MSETNLYAPRKLTYVQPFLVYTPHCVVLNIVLAGVIIVETATLHYGHMQLMMMLMMTTTIVLYFL